ncbi:DUF551 domain-containing protein [Escherichia coli]|uniref:DUF551 domain-containing protein n=1 Tax=Escherichia coli TaxID=562 RepID=UPI0006A62FFE|nr:DUF551 domain-containing protein [Escherichia coli]
MTTFTDKELIKEIKERIGSLDVRDNIERRAYEIALASLEAEPVAWLHSDNGLGIPAITRSKNIADSWLSKGWYVQPLYIAKPVLVVPDARPSLNNGIVGFDEGWNACRATMLQSQGEGNPHVTPARLPGGFTIEDAKALHEDLVRSHISQALSGEKMKKKDRDADLRWIHDVIVQAACFVKASLEQNALSGNYPVTPDGWISCSERMPDDGQHVIILCDGAFVLYAQYRDGEFFDIVRNGDEFFETQSRNVTDWMQLPEPPL